VLDNFATGRRSNTDAIGDELELVEGDIQSYERAHKAVRGCEVIFHQAALPSVPRSIQDPLTSNATNVIGTLNILLAARDEDVRRVVFASSSSVYGANPTLPTHEDMATLPISPYSTAKLAGEGYCRSFGIGYGLETVALRYFNVFGARQDPTSQYAAAVPNFITALLDNRPITIFGDGEQPAAPGRADAAPAGQRPAARPRRLADRAPRPGLRRAGHGARRGPHVPRGRLGVALR